MKYHLMDLEDATAYYPILHPGPWATVLTELGLQLEYALFRDSDGRLPSKNVFHVRDWNALVVVDLHGRYGSSLPFAERISRIAGKKTLVLYGLPEVGKYNINVARMSPYPAFAADDEVYHFQQCSGCDMIDLVKLARPVDLQDLNKTHIVCGWPGALYRSRPKHVRHPPACNGGVPAFTDSLLAAFQKGLDEYYMRDL